MIVGGNENKNGEVDKPYLTLEVNTKLRLESMSRFETLIVGNKMSHHYHFFFMSSLSKGILRVPLILPDLLAATRPAF